MTSDAIRTYLAQLGLEHIDPANEQIHCWNSLQQFLERHAISKPPTRPIRNTRLKTYGLDQSHPVRMLIQHVLY
jgi:hypothetical protein